MLFRSERERERDARCVELIGTDETIFMRELGS